MAINKKLIHFNSKENFENKVANNEILDTSIAFVKDSKEIWTHGKLYKSVNWSTLGEDDNTTNGYYAELQNKTLEITENGTIEITADTGYYGLNKVEIISNVESDEYRYAFLWNSVVEGRINTEILKSCNELAFSAYGPMYENRVLSGEEFSTMLADVPYNQINNIRSKYNDFPAVAPVCGKWKIGEVVFIFNMYIKIDHVFVDTIIREFQLEEITKEEYEQSTSILKYWLDSDDEDNVKLLHSSLHEIYRTRSTEYFHEDYLYLILKLDRGNIKILDRIIEYDQEWDRFIVSYREFGESESSGWSFSVSQTEIGIIA